MCLAHDRTQKNMREWLSWWSTTLPRSGPRVRVPSRALIKLYIDDVFQIRSTKTCASGSVGGARPCQGRGRGFESRLALSFIKKGHPSDVLFLKNRVLPGSNFRVSSLPLRSAHSGHPPDVLRRLALLSKFCIFRKFFRLHVL